MQDQFLMRFHLFPRLPHDAALPWECIEKVYASFSQLWNNRQQKKKSAINTEQLVADRDNLLLNRAANHAEGICIFCFVLSQLNITQAKRGGTRDGGVTSAAHHFSQSHLGWRASCPSGRSCRGILEWRRTYTRMPMLWRAQRSKTTPPDQKNQKESKPSTTSSNLWLLTLIVKIQVKKRSTEWIQT